MSTLKEQIKATIVGHLQNIAPGNSITVNGSEYVYQTAAGANVHEELEYTEHEDTLPYLALFFGKNLINKGTTPPNGFDHHTLEIAIEGVIDDDKNGAEGEKLRRDIVQTVRSESFCAGFLIGKPSELSSETAVQQGEEVTSFVRVEFNIIYRTREGGE